MNVEKEKCRLRLSAQMATVAARPLHHRTTAAYTESTHNIIPATTTDNRHLRCVWLNFFFFIFSPNNSGGLVWPYNFYCWLYISKCWGVIFVGKWKSHKISANCYFHFAHCRNCKLRELGSFFQPIIYYLGCTCRWKLQVHTIVNRE